MIIDTPEKMERRKKKFENERIEALLSLYNRRYSKGDLAGARRVEWVLSKYFGIEGDRTYAIGSSQE